MKLWKSEKADDNYVASVITIKSIKDHPDADRLQIVEVFGNEIIVAKGQYNVGQDAVYFPIESSISPKFLSWANLFDKAELNADQKTKGFFSVKGCRVKAVKLRGVPSQGFIYPYDKFLDFCKTIDPDFKPKGAHVSAIDFDMIDEFQLLEKYIPKGTQKQSVKREPTKFEKVVAKFPRAIRKPILKVYNRKFNKKPEGIQSKIYDDYFHFHYKTNHLGKSVHTIQPEDEIVITSKLHGCVKHDTPIETEEHGILPISKIVDDRLKCRVRGYDTESGEIKWVNVDDYYFKPDDGEWYEIELENGEKITITGNNPVWLPELNCYRRVDELSEDDILLVENFR